MIWLVLWISSAQAAIPDGLRHFYDLALKQSEVLDMAKSRATQAEERKDQAVGALFPTVAARYTYTGIQPPPAAGGATGAFTRPNQYTTQLALSQPIFRWSTIPAYRYSQADIALQRKLVEQAGLTLWQDVALAYYNAWLARLDRANVMTLQEYTTTRVKDLRDRVRVGRSRKGELLQAESLLGSVEAESARTVRTQAEVEERVTFLAGTSMALEFGTLPEVASVTGPLGDYLKRAENRPDIKAKEQELQLTEELISGAKAGHMPTVDFTSNYYLMRTGVLKDSKWDVGLAVSLPLFAGGSVNALVKERVEKRRETILALARLRREVERDIRTLWQGSTALDQVLKDLRLVVQKSRASYEENKRDYTYGLVSNQDVLLSLNQYADAKRSYDRTVIEKELVTLQLTLATGEKP